MSELTPAAFLDEQPNRRGLSLDAASLTPVAAFDGRGAHALEVAIATSVGQPRTDAIRRAWKARQGGAASPLLLVVAYEVDGSWKAAICGPAGDEPPVETNLDLGLVERIAKAALDQPSRHQAIRFLGGILAEVESELPGIRNHGMLAAQELREGVPQRRDWGEACSRARPMLNFHGRALVEKLGFHVEHQSTATTVLSIGAARRAVAVFLDENEEFEAPAARFGDTSPVTHALAYADRAELPWVVVTRGPEIRLYSARPDVGVGRKGRADTYVEANLALVPDDLAGYVTLLFSADALKTDGTLTAILDASRDHASALGVRLRDRVYEDAVPSLALALASRYGGALDEAALDTIYEQALTVLFRLLFVAYAEDKDLLPYRSNGAYRDHALKTLARHLAERQSADSLVFDRHATDLWDEVVGLWTAVDKGNVERGVPPYNGGLFSSNARVNEAGSALAGCTLTNAEFGPALVALLVDTGEEGVVGPVDFRSLSVREFGTIYEGLLESDLAVAPSDLALDREQNYVPAKDGQEVVVKEGGVYFHNRSGARKSSGSYFTKSFAVEHLLDHALEPALTAHLDRVQGLLDSAEEARAAEAFFDFRCVDIAMGSGHFLVAAVDRIEARLSGFLALNPIPQVTAELDRLRAAAYEALGPLGEGVEIEYTSLLRRQVARRCIYGVDLNPMAVELARLGIWIHTFVPGLPLSFLDHSLVSGDSLTGIGTLDEAIHALDPEQLPGQPSLFRDEILEVLGRAESALRKLARTADASAADIRDARAAQAEALEAVQPARALFDLIVAARLDEVSPPTRFDEPSLFSNPEITKASNVALQMRALHFPIAFPEVFLREHSGFDCILGNPPWDKVRFEAQQFWVSRAPGLNALSTARREQEISRLRLLRPNDAALEREDEETRERLQRYFARAFSFQGTGHLEFAKLFLERALDISAAAGTLGYVLPRQFAVLGGWAKLRRRLIVGGDTTVAQARNRGGWLFDDIDHRIMVAFTSRRPAVTEDDTKVAILAGITTLALLNDPSEPLLMNLGDIESLSDAYVLPWLNEAGDRVIFDAMRSQPRLGAGDSWISADVDSGRWDFSGSGSEGSFAKTQPSPGSWRVLMARHVKQFGLDEEKAFTRFVPEPERLVAINRGLVDRASPHFGADHPALVLRYPSRNDDARTLIVSPLPQEGFFFSTGYVHGITHSEDASHDEVLGLLGYLNSFTADWWVRRFVDRHVTKPVMVNLPLPDWSPGQVREAAHIVAELCRRGGVTEMAGGFTGTGPEDADDRTQEELLVSLEQIVIGGFKLTVHDLKTILDDFSDRGCPPPLRQAMLS